MLLIFLAFWSRPSVAHRAEIPPSKTRSDPPVSCWAWDRRELRGARSADPARPARRRAERSRPRAGAGRLPASLARSPQRVCSRRARGVRDEGGEPGAPLGPQGAVGLRRRGAGAALPGRARPQPGRLGGRGGGGRCSALQGGGGGGGGAGALPAVRYERLLQPPAEAGAHHPAQQESQQSGDPAARYRLHPGPAAGAGDAPGSAEAAAPAGATAPPGRDLSGRAAADPAHRAQHRPGRRGQQAGRQHSVSLSRPVQVCGRLSPSQETREGGGRAEVKRKAPEERRKNISKP